VLEGEGRGREVVVRRMRCQLRAITLPPGWWFDLNMGEWIEGGRTLQYAAGLDEVPLFIADGAIIPWYNGAIRNSLMDPGRLELHIFCKQQPGHLTYYSDDQQTRSYQTGVYNTLQIDAQIAAGQLRITISESGGYPAGTVEFTPVLYGQQGHWQAQITSSGRTRMLDLQPSTRPWICKSIEVLAASADSL
jgi:alpha-glucosidase